MIIIFLTFAEEDAMARPGRRVLKLKAKGGQDEGRHN